VPLRISHSRPCRLNTKNWTYSLCLIKYPRNLWCRFLRAKHVLTKSSMRGLTAICQETNLMLSLLFTMLFPSKERSPKTLKGPMSKRHKLIKQTMPNKKSNTRKSYKKHNWTSILRRPKMNKRTSKSKSRLIVWQTMTIMATLTFRWLKKRLFSMMLSIKITLENSRWGLGRLKLSCEPKKRGTDKWCREKRLSGWRENRRRKSSRTSRLNNRSRFTNNNLTTTIP